MPLNLATIPADICILLSCCCCRQWRFSLQQPLPPLLQHKRPVPPDLAVVHPLSLLLLLLLDLALQVTDPKVDGVVVSEKDAGGILQEKNISFTIASNQLLDGF